MWVISVLFVVGCTQRWKPASLWSVSCLLLAERTANGCALCRAFLVFWMHLCSNKWAASGWMRVKGMCGEEKHTVNGHFLHFWLSWWCHDSSTVQCTCSCVVFLFMNYWNCKFIVFCYAPLIIFLSFFFKLYSPVLQVPVHFLIQECHQEITVLFILNA